MIVVAIGAEKGGVVFGSIRPRNDNRRRQLKEPDLRVDNVESFDPRRCVGDSIRVSPFLL